MTILRLLLGTYLAFGLAYGLTELFTWRHVKEFLVTTWWLGLTLLLSALLWPIAVLEDTRDARRRRRDRQAEYRRLISG